MRRITEELRPELAAWVEFNLSTGCTASQLKDTLVTTGYAEGEVSVFLQQQFERLGTSACAELADASPVRSDAEAVARFWSRTKWLDERNVHVLDAGSARVLARDSEHGIYYLTDFLSEAECQYLIDGASKQMSPSTVVDSRDGGEIRNKNRTSESSYFARGNGVVIQSIERRIALLTGIPVLHGESIGILRYATGGEYRAHHDSFDPKTPGGASLIAEGGQRLLTMILYLNSVDAGGATRFPTRSIEFAPRRGAALLFPALDRRGELMIANLHAGCPVTAGEKWIATKWLRTRPFRSVPKPLQDAPAALAS